MATLQPHRDAFDSPLARARGLGSAHAGFGHWWHQRLSSLALIPLSLWFICSVIRLEGASRADVAAWLSHPLPMTLAIALVVATFHHLQSGLQVVLEDYVHENWIKLGAVLAIKGLSFLLAVACIVSVLRLGL